MSRSYWLKELLVELRDSAADSSRPLDKQNRSGPLATVCGDLIFRVVAQGLRDNLHLPHATTACLPLFDRRRLLIQTLIASFYQQIPTEKVNGLNV